MPTTDQTQRLIDFVIATTPHHPKDRDVLTLLVEIVLR